MANTVATVGAQRRTLAFQAETDTDSRVWSVFYVSRQIGLVAAAVVVAALPDFGPDRFLIAAAALFGVVPYDLWLHWRTRREGRVPWASLVELLMVPLFILWEPRVWVPAVLGSLVALAFFATAYRMPVPAVLFAVEGALVAAAGAIADVDALVEGLVAYVMLGIPLVLAVSVLFQSIVSADRRYRDFLEYASDMVYTHDLQTLRFLTVNDAALHRTGYSRAEIGDITVAEIVAPEHLAKAAEMIQRKLEGDADATTYELEIVTKDGRRIPVEVSTRVIFRRGEAVAIQGIARDVSDRKRVEEQRVSLDKARSEFIANAAHELRTPLTTLAGLASVLASTRDRMSEEEMAGAVEALDRQGRRARVLADKLLDLSSAELGAIDVVREPVDVAAIVERALEDAPPPDGKTVDVLLEPDLSAMGDSLRLQEILHNLLTNAYRYGGANVRVEGAVRNDAVVLAVADDGPGVPVDLRPHLFEPFARGDHAEATGLGLAICARLAEAQGGEIGYEPAEPGGSRFFIRLTPVW